jgi:hypothetical protein
VSTASANRVLCSPADWNSDRRDGAPVCSHQARATKISGESPQSAAPRPARSAQSADGSASPSRPPTAPVLAIKHGAGRIGERGTDVTQRFMDREAVRGGERHDDVAGIAPVPDELVEARAEVGRPVVT